MGPIGQMWAETDDADPKRWEPAMGAALASAIGTEQTKPNAIKIEDSLGVGVKADRDPTDGMDDDFRKDLDAAERFRMEDDSSED